MGGEGRRPPGRDYIWAHIGNLLVKIAEDARVEAMVGFLRRWMNEVLGFALKNGFEH